MFKLFFGIVWTAITTLAFYLLYGDIGGTIRVNGQVVSQKVFNTMWWPKLLLGIFLFIGLYLIYTSIRHIVQNIKTAKYGEEYIGFVLGIFETGCYSGNSAELGVDIAVLDNYGELKVYKEVLGFGRPLYVPGTYVKVKLYENDINLISPSPVLDVPEDLKLVVESEFKKI